VQLRPVSVFNDKRDALPDRFIGILQSDVERIHTTLRAWRNANEDIYPPGSGLEFVVVVSRNISRL
jgi:hypothetical protein